MATLADHDRLPPAGRQGAPPSWPGIHTLMPDWRGGRGLGDGFVGWLPCWGSSSIRGEQNTEKATLLSCQRAGGVVSIGGVRASGQIFRCTPERPATHRPNYWTYPSQSERGAAARDRLHTACRLALLRPLITDIPAIVWNYFTGLRPPRQDQHSLRLCQF